LQLVWGISKPDFNNIANGSEPQVYNKTSIFDTFKEQGYVTGLARDYCEVLNPENG
jgi:hypothetical protein